MIIHKPVGTIKSALVVSVLAVLGCLLLGPGVSQAHVLIPGASKQSGTVLHITPEDDPVAGLISGLHYEIKNLPGDGSGNVAKLTITKVNKETVSVPLKQNGRFIFGEYTFPVRGVYGLELSLTTKAMGVESVQTYRTALRVSRGISGQSVAVSAPAWATAGSLAAVWGMAALVLIGSGRRRRIAKHSR